MGVMRGMALIPLAAAPLSVRRAFLDCRRVALAENATTLVTDRPPSIAIPRGSVNSPGSEKVSFFRFLKDRHGSIRPIERVIGQIGVGCASVTRVDYPGEEDLGIVAFSENRRATLKSVDIWQMNQIWR